MYKTIHSLLDSRQYPIHKSDVGVNHRLDLIKHNNLKCNIIGRIQGYAIMP